MAELVPALFHEMFGDPVRNDEGWRTATLAEACTKITDGTHFSPPTVAHGTPYVTAKHLNKYGLDFERDPSYISDEHHREIFARCDPRLGDVLYIKDGATTGQAAVNRYGFEFSMLSSLALLRPDRNVCDSEYLNAWLNDESVKLMMMAQMAGSAIRRLTLEKIKRSHILLPPIGKQSEFAALEKKIRQVQDEQTTSRFELQGLFESQLNVLMGVA
ncbi:MAG: hypothetical protein AB7G88_01045 [Thermomicrobiales bacterium]